MVIPNSEFRIPNSEAGGAGLYIHVPFCTSVCPYCDFAVTIVGEERRSKWFRGVAREAALYTERGLVFDTVYFGGGTPSSAAVGHISKLLGEIRSRLEIKEDATISLEANPEDVTAENVAAWRALGVGVVSLGVQSFDDASLAFLGRSHSGDEAFAAAETLLGTGFESVSIDLIYGLPGQTAGDWGAQLARVISLCASHLSCYQLTFHERTVLGRRLRRGMVSRPPEDTESELFFLTHRRLVEAGYQGYEVSNFAFSPRHRSHHNQKYWNHSPYLGLGPSAHSFVDGRRWWNRRKLRLWQREVDSGRVPIEGHERPTENQLTLEALMLGLRTTDGVDLGKVGERFGVDIVGANVATIDRFRESGHLTVDGPRIRPTLEGLAIADTLAREFILPD